MGTTDEKRMILFHDGREKAIDVKRMIEFENKSTHARFFKGYDEVSAKTLLEELGACAIDYTNVHQTWSKTIPDIHPDSTRLFIIWGEDSKTKEIVSLIRGFFLLVPFTATQTTLSDYYMLEEKVPYYPYAIVTSFRTIYNKKNDLEDLINQLLEKISFNWQKQREKTISRLKEGTEIWERFMLSFDKIIHFSFQCPSIDREVIDILKRKGYQITATMHILASASSYYDKAAIDHHTRLVYKILDESEKRRKDS